MADWALLGGIGKGVTEGLDDKRKMDEAAQMKQLRQYQLDQLKGDQEYSKSLKGLKKVGSATYDNSFQKQGAGVDQAKALDAQTADFGAEGAQATADALAGAKGLSRAEPVKSIPYAASEQARDIADLALKAGKPEIAAQFGDRAFTLGTREVQERVNNWARAAQNMSLSDAAKSLADIHTADKTDFGAFLRKDPNNKDGLPEVTLFNSKTGAYETHTVRSKEELIQLGQSLVDHNARNDVMKMQMEQAKLGLQARDTAAKEGAVDINRAEFNAKRDAGLYTAQADNFKAEAESRRLKSPAEAAQAWAHADYFKKMSKAVSEKGKALEERLGDGEKIFLNSLKEVVARTTVASAQDPTPQNIGAAQTAKFNLARQLRKFGVESIDEYQLSGVPRPEVAAVNVLSDKPNPKAIEAAVQGAAARFGTEYAMELKQALDAKLADKAKTGTSNTVGQAPPLTPKGIVTGSINPESVAGRLSAGYDRAQTRAAGAPDVKDNFGRTMPKPTPGLVDIFRE